MRVSPGAPRRPLEVVEPPAPSRVVVVRVPQLLLDAVDVYCGGTGRSRSVAMRMALVMFLAAAAHAD